jgi:pilus assembly protein CpaB
MKFSLADSRTALIAAILCGGLAVFAASRYMTETLQREKAKLQPNVESIQIVVAKRNLDRGDIVSSENMAVRQVPKDFVPGTAVGPESFANVEGARLAVGMRVGEILLHGTLEGADASTFATKIENGVRAVTLTVDEVNSISGLLQPHDRVDLFYTSKPIGGGGFSSSGGDQTRLLLQNVTILATGRQVRPSITSGAQTGVGRAFTTVTIEASPLDAQRLILAEKSGHLTAALRGAKDEDTIAAKVMDVRSLFSSGTPATIQHGIPLRTEVIVGGKGKLESEMLRIAALDRADRFGPVTTARHSRDANVERDTSNTDAGASKLQQLLQAPSVEALSLPR